MTAVAPGPVHCAGRRRRDRPPATHRTSSPRWRRVTAERRTAIRPAIWSLGACDGERVLIGGERISQQRLRRRHRGGPLMHARSPVRADITFVRLLEFAGGLTEATVNRKCAKMLDHLGIFCWNTAAEQRR